LKRLMKLLGALAVLASLTTGCAVNRATASVDPATQLDAIKSVHVARYEKDDRGVDKIIADKLRARGFQVSQGAAPQGKVDALVTYVDRWMWDITMYMLELTVVFRDPKNEFPLATGNSYHTSLTRKSPPEMVDEVIENILKEGKKK
jgi:hypothetical protein